MWSHNSGHRSGIPPHSSLLSYCAQSEVVQPASRQARSADASAAQPPSCRPGHNDAGGCEDQGGCEEGQGSSQRQGLDGFGSSFGSGAAIGPGSGSEATRSGGLDTLLESRCFSWS